mmetsp:Transcript_31296/g.66238  ORF Transcript_31296/g.66238 Transcript_31296/m.66238 type:complete len:87 (+) Transcript_31296:939-1199(+)
MAMTWAAFLDMTRFDCGLVGGSGSAGTSHLAESTALAAVRATTSAGDTCSVCGHPHLGHHLRWGGIGGTTLATMLLTPVLDWSGSA